MPHTTFAPHTIGSTFFDLVSFGFGKTDTDANTEFYEDLLNSDEDEYGQWANST